MNKNLKIIFLLLVSLLNCPVFAQENCNLILQMPFRYGEPKKVKGQPKTAESILSKWQIPQKSIAADFVRLVYNQNLISQTDGELWTRDLLGKGGLCNITSIGAVVKTLGIQESHADQIEEACHFISAKTGRDAREGSSTQSGLDYLLSLIEEERLIDTIYLQPSMYLKMPKLLPGEISLSGIGYKGSKPGDELIIENNAYYLGHAVVLVATNDEQSKVLMFDPNIANTLTEVDIEIDQADYILRYKKRWAKFAESTIISRGPLRSLSSEQIDRLSK